MRIDTSFRPLQFIAIALLGFGVGHATAQAVVNRDYLKPPTVQRLPSIALGEAASLGSGYAITAASVRSPSMRLESKRSSSETGVYYDLEYVEDFASLSSVLSVSASASYGAPGASASARVNLLREAKMSRTSAYVLVRMTVLTRKDVLDHNELLPIALEVASKQGELGFYPKYGDCFISSIIYGGELLGLLEFSATNAQTSESLRASVSGGVSQAKGSVDYEKAITTLTSNATVKVKYAESGGSLKSQAIVTLTPTDLIARMKAFTPEIVASIATNKPLFAELKEYSASENVPANVRMVEPKPQSTLLEGLGRTALLLREDFATADAIMAAGDTYPAAMRNAATARRAYAEYALLRVREAFNAVAARPLETHRPAIEGFAQYRVERRLGVPSGISRANAQGTCDLVEVDPDRIRNCLFGPVGPFKVEQWPVHTAWTTTRIIVGEGLDHFRLHGTDIMQQPRHPINWLANPVIGCIDPEAWARAHCGSPAGAERVFVKVQQAGAPIGGARCGFTPVDVSCLRVQSPQRPLFPELSEYPVASLAARPLNARATRTAAGFRLEFDVGAANCPQAAGRYLITATALSKEAKLGVISEIGYWRRMERREFTISHLIPLGSWESVKDVSVQLGESVCE